MRDIVVTNLRINKQDWTQLKAMAGELGMSVNEYVNDIIKNSTAKRTLALDKKPAKKKYSIWDLPKLAKLPDEPMGLSEDDKLIYGAK